MPADIASKKSSAKKTTARAKTKKRADPNSSTDKKKLRNPYVQQPKSAFWKHAVSGHQLGDLNGVSNEIPGLETAKIATAGSCFAQHIGQNLRKNGLNYLELETPPKIIDKLAAQKFGYGVYSCRYGNIYTTRQLVQLFDEAFDQRTPLELVWKDEQGVDSRYYDALRPGVYHDGLSSPEEVLTLRKSHLKQVKKMFETLDIFVFTLGLTEQWRLKADGTAFPIAPGVIAGKYTPKEYEFVNAGFVEIYQDLEVFVEKLRAINPSAKLLLTVSPVPLAATATNEHVLVASTYSKSVLRAVAGELAASDKAVFYFPSYELVVGQPTRHGLYAPDLRNVTSVGVEQVMQHFFAQLDARKSDIGDHATHVTKASNVDQTDDRDIGFEECEEGLLGDQYASS